MTVHICTVKKHKKREDGCPLFSFYRMHGCDVCIFFIFVLLCNTPCNTTREIFIYSVTFWGFESPRRHHIGASLVSLAPIFFQKVRVRSRRCSSYPNRTRSIGLRFGGASAGRNALILLDCRETTVSPTDCEQTVRSVLLLCKGNRRAGEQRARCPVFRA